MTVSALMKTSFPEVSPHGRLPLMVIVPFCHQGKEAPHIGGVLSSLTHHLLMQPTLAKGKMRLLAEVKVGVCSFPGLHQAAAPHLEHLV